MISNSETRDGYLRTFIPLCAANLCLFFCVVMAMYTSYEFGHDAFWDIEFPNRSRTTSNDSYQSICDTTNTSGQGDQDEQVVQAVVSRWNLYISIAQGVPLIFSSLFFSSLSDFFGRRPFLLLGTFSICIKYILFTLTVIFQWNIYLFIPFSIVDSLCGGWMTQLAIAMSVISDLTNSGKSRSFLIAVFSFVFGIGFSLGSFLSGYMVTLLGYDYSMAIASGMSAAAFIITWFIPESLSDSQRKGNFTLMGNVKEIFRFYTKNDPTSAGSTRWQFITLMLSFTLIMISRLGGAAFETFYLLDSPFCFSPETISVFETVRTCIAEIMILIFIKLMQRCFQDEVIAFLGSISSVALFVLFGIAPSKTFLYIAVVIGSIGMCSIPLTRGILSKMTPPHDQGVLFGGIAVVENICNLTGSIIGNAIYSETVSFYKGTAYLVFAGFMFLAMILLLFLVKNSPQTYDRKGTVSSQKHLIN